MEVTSRSFLSEKANIFTKKNVSCHIVQHWLHFQFLFYKGYKLVFLQQHGTLHWKKIIEFIFE